MNANAYGGELARVLEWVGRLRRRGGASDDPGRPRLLLPALEPAAGRGRVARVVPPRAARAGRDQGDARRTCAASAARRSPPGIKTFGSTFKNPDDPTRRGPHGRAAARGGGLPRPCGRRRALLAQARELRRERRRGHDRRHARPDGRGPAARPRAIRRRRWSPRCRCSATSSGRPTGTGPRRARDREGATSAGAARIGAREARRDEAASRRRAGRSRAIAAKKSTASPPLQESAARRPTAAMTRLLPLLVAWRTRRSSLVLAGALAIAYFAWFRDSSLVAVNDVKVEGGGRSSSRQGRPRRRREGHVDAGRRRLQSRAP